MFAPSFFEHLSDRLELAVYDINQEYLMGIADLRQQHAHIPGIQGLTMQNGNGGKTEIYVMGDVRVELPTGSSSDSIGTALQNAMPSALARVDQAVAALSPKKKLNPELAA